MDNLPLVSEMIDESNLKKHKVYNAKHAYRLVFVNKKLYEKIFNEKYDEMSQRKLEEMFSVTLEEEMSNHGQIVGEGYADIQKDASGISLAGNLGSGRAFFYKKYFNLKGEKTALATAEDIYYSDGKLCLPAALKESVFSNILAKEYDNNCFQTLAVFDKDRYYIFRQQFQDENDEIHDEFFKLKEAIEVRYYEEGQFFRISNKMANGTPFEEEQLRLLCENIGKMEANKFIDRFLHGSWSAGNLTVSGNMLDFDTVCFVEGRHPQFSNTNKYKASYFGYELLGQKMLVKNIVDYNEKLGVNISYEMAEKYIDEAYSKQATRRFCDILGLDYERHYQKNKAIIDELFESFNTLSRQFLPNYLELNVNADYVNNTYLYNFSRLFQKYLLKRRQNNDILQALSLLLAPTKKIEYEKVGKIKEIVQQNFEDILIEDDGNLALKTFKDISAFTSLISQLYEKFTNEELEIIKRKAYVVNYDRHYLYNNNFLFDKINLLHEKWKLTDIDIDNLINALIETNIRNCDFAKEENFKLGLKICNTGLYYFEVSKDGFKIVYQPFGLESFDRNKVSFAKVYVDGKDYYLSHNGDQLESEFIKTEGLVDIDEFDIKLKINGNWQEAEDILTLNENKF